MANFTGHFNAGAFVSGGVSLLLAYKGIIAKNDAFLYFAVGTACSVLPDVDHKSSTPLKIIKTVISNTVAFVVVMKHMQSYPVLNLALIWGAAYLLTQALFVIFAYLTRHRGVFHSLPMPLFIGFFVSDVSYYVFNSSVKESVLTGFFAFLGYVTHLFVDYVSGSKRGLFRIFTNSLLADTVVYALLLVSVMFTPVLFLKIKGVLCLI